MACAVACSEVNPIVVVLHPVEVSAYNVFGLKEYKAIRQGILKVFNGGQQGLLYVLCILDAVGDVYFLFFQRVTRNRLKMKKAKSSTITKPPPAE